MTQIVNGAKTETNLCEVCAQEDTAINFGFEPKWLLHNVFADLFNQQPLAGNKKVSTTRVKPVQCENCGFTESKFTQVGKLGCPECYQVFENKLDHVLRRVGGTLGIRKEIEKFKLALQEAVGREEYEKAAEIRDKIRSLENEIR